ncbi:MAG: hypothetical protein MJ025_03815 [Victivallaceae bacterium]|nr:hypothetical protein [Victivallaceae bacterium]
MKLAVLLLACVLAVAGCKSKDAETPQPVMSDFTTASRGEARRIAQDYIDRLAESIRTGKIDSLQEVLPKNMAKRDNRAKFKEMMSWIDDKLGKLEDCKYLDEFRQGASSDFYWKLTFCKESPDGTKSVNDVPYSVRVVHLDGKIQIVRAGFDFR